MLAKGWRVGSLYVTLTTQSASPLSVYGRARQLLPAFCGQAAQQCIYTARSCVTRPYIAPQPFLRMRQPTFVGETLVVAYGATEPILRNVATRSYVCRCRLAHLHQRIRQSCQQLLQPASPIACTRSKY
ncbi:hypothetical protein CCHR01_06670 [Colletotrichum chrysophilum]|uniref:Uncharacterized protein n=1 Tax=Colletotrichum chrysophilum TaxID=1836956 RepID=A0AAD9ANK6_9PEZI|nr:hypothetical protein CCHR01_06670 [Colletotrichum chrysophilum]